MKQTFEIRTSLPALNEVIAASKNSPYDRRKKMKELISSVRQMANRARTLKKNLRHDSSAEDVLKQMDGHPILDDPPQGYSKRDIIMWCRGYLYAEAVQGLNWAERLDFIADGIERIERNEDKAEYERKYRERTRLEAYSITQLRKIGKLLQIKNYSRISKKKLIEEIIQVP